MDFIYFSVLFLSYRTGGFLWVDDSVHSNFGLFSVLMAYAVYRVTYVRLVYCINIYMYINWNTTYLLQRMCSYHKFLPCALCMCFAISVDVFLIVLEIYYSIFFLMIIYFSHPQHIRLAKRFTKLLSKDSRFEQIGRTTMGLVCFRLKVRSVDVACAIICVRGFAEE